MSVYSDTILATTGLTNYWRMDDPSGTTLTADFGALTGTIGAAVGYDAASLIPADSNTALDFTGASNSWCHTIAGAGHGFTGITWECWANPDTIPSDGTFRTIWLSDGGTGPYLQMDGDGFEYRMNTNAGGSGVTDAATNLFTAGVSVHIALTWSAADPNTRLYKNGVQISTAARSGATVVSANNSNIGATSSGGDLFDGKIDEVALYNVALSPATIAEHYAIGSQALNATPDRIYTQGGVPTPGASPISNATAWLYGSWVSLLPAGWRYPIAIMGLSFQSPTPATAVDTTDEQLFEIGTGAVGAEVMKLQVPHTSRMDTAVGYTQPAQSVFFAEPYVVPESTRVAVRATDSITGATTYSGVKIFFREIGVPRPTICTSSEVVNRGANW